MPEMSRKCKSNPTKTNNLIYIMIFFPGGGGKKIPGGLKKFGALRAPHCKNLPPPPYRIQIMDRQKIEGKFLQEILTTDYTN